MLWGLDVIAFFCKVRVDWCCFCYLQVFQMHKLNQWLKMIKIKKNVRMHMFCCTWFSSFIVAIRLFAQSSDSFYCLFMSLSLSFFKGCSAFSVYRMSSFSLHSMAKDIRTRKRSFWTLEVRIPMRPMIFFFFFFVLIVSAFVYTGYNLFTTLEIFHLYRFGFENTLLPCTVVERTNAL